MFPLIPLLKEQFVHATKLQELRLRARAAGLGENQFDQILMRVKLRAQASLTWGNAEQQLAAINALIVEEASGYFDCLSSLGPRSRPMKTGSP